MQFKGLELVCPQCRGALDWAGPERLEMGWLARRLPATRYLLRVSGPSLHAVARRRG